MTFSQETHKKQKNKVWKAQMNMAIYELYTRVPAVVEWTCGQVCVLCGNMCLQLGCHKSIP
jgi:hypothetical protein